MGRQNFSELHANGSLMATPISYSSKLPGEQASIFSVMAQKARKYKALDVSQGYPDFEMDPDLQNLVTGAMQQGKNQYAPLEGLAALREQISLKIQLLHKKTYDYLSEVTVTNGATQALFLAITAFVRPGEKVLILKPAYDSYEPAVTISGGIPVPIPLKGPEYEINWEALEENLGPDTRMIIINNPHNPSGRVWSREEMNKLAGLLQDTQTLLLSDEVYEHLVFDGRTHISVSAVSQLAERAIVCASFGKIFHNTGWKMGYCVAPRELMKEIQKIHQINVFCVHHPTQSALAEYLKEPRHYLELSHFYQTKRDYFLRLIRNSRFQWTPAQGTYFQLLSYHSITDQPDVEYAEWLVREHRISTIPVSVFNHNRKDWKQLRICFAKKDETLEQAAEVINKL